MNVVGSPSFVARVNASLSLYHPVAIQSITEDADVFTATDDVYSDVLIGWPVAFWPDASPDLQTRILATYIAHEDEHARLRTECVHSGTHCLDWTDEELPMVHQREVAAQLGVPLQFVDEPWVTVRAGKRTAYAFVPSSFTKIAGLLFIAAGTVTLKHYAFTSHR